MVDLHDRRDAKTKSFSGAVLRLEEEVITRIHDDRNGRVLDLGWLEHS
mgnify:FL=1